MIQIKVTPEQQKIRLDHFLKEAHLSDLSRASIISAIKSGIILINGSQVKAGYLLRTDDVIEIGEIKKEQINLEAVDMNLDIVYEDDDLMVINKPQGLVVHPAPSYKKPTLVHGLLFETNQLSDLNGEVRPGIVHRLDKDTSGLLVVAKNDLTHQVLSDQLAKHEVQRIYYAIVYGHFLEEEGSIDAPIDRNPKNRLKMAIHPGGKEAKTHFKVLERFQNFTLVECRLETGRTHQIRVHMAYIKHPLVGDPLYGPKETIGKTGQYLHAKSLTFFHPTKKKQMNFEIDLPLYFTNYLEHLRQDSVW